MSTGRPPTGSTDGDPPIFIACGARTGSTLLRWLVDSHPDIACPSETDLADLLRAHLRTATALGSPDPLVQARGDVDALMAAHLLRRTKSRWCDKSLSNVAHLELLASAWPDARFLLLHRHCMDFIVSALDAQPWGLVDYGFSEFAGRAPGDSVTALASYWIDRTTKMLRFEESAPERCLRIRYEDLVAKPDDVASELWSFLGAEPWSGAAESAFSSAHDGSGPADYKVWYTTGVHADSVGRGARVPPDRIRGPVRSCVNELLEELGYDDRVDGDWGSGGPVGPEAPGEDGAIELRIVDGHRVVWHRAIDPSPVGDGRWALIDRPVGRPRTLVVVEAEILPSLVAGRHNPGDALRRRAIRHYGSRPADFGEEQVLFRGLVHFVMANAGLFGGLVPHPAPDGRPAPALAGVACPGDGREGDRRGQLVRPAGR